MRAVNSFIVTPLGGELFNNYKTVDGKKIAVSTSIEGHTTTNRHAVVTSVPGRYNGPIKDGYFLVVHHNTFRKTYDMQGVEKFAAGHIRDNYYMIDDIEIFAYRKSQKDAWIPIEPFCFVEPILDTNDDNKNAMIELNGIMKYSNKELTDQGVNNGDHVVFTPDSEYEFMLDDQKLYKINSSSICLKL